MGGNQSSGAVWLKVAVMDWQKTDDCFAYMALPTRHKSIKQ